jgi:hypothetical protein
MMPKIEVLPFLKSRKGCIIRRRNENKHDDNKIEIYDGTRGDATCWFDHIDYDTTFESLKEDGLIARDDAEPGTDTAQRYTITVMGLAHLETSANNRLS